ncbi:unnamed protein product [Gongylonema pulchrum]|uniref:RNA polymerase II subunit B1 CTD phosphatase RPAP2 homolog n=1 Tax=Gongylonema pulchrum TaxID=637853 RepID=A0A183DRS6_9BILA|nr:unnamed protein product [Gongylonema pulchrum]
MDVDNFVIIDEDEGSVEMEIRAMASRQKNLAKNLKGGVSDESGGTVGVDSRQGHQDQGDLRMQQRDGSFRVRSENIPEQQRFSELSAHKALLEEKRESSDQVESRNVGWKRPDTDEVMRELNNGELSVSEAAAAAAVISELQDREVSNASVESCASTSTPKTQTKSAKSTRKTRREEWLKLHPLASKEFGPGIYEFMRNARGKLTNIAIKEPGRDCIRLYRRSSFRYNYNYYRCSRCDRSISAKKDQSSIRAPVIKMVGNEIVSDPYPVHCPSCKPLTLSELRSIQVDREYRQEVMEAMESPFEAWSKGKLRALLEAAKVRARSPTDEISPERKRRHEHVLFQAFLEGMPLASTRSRHGVAPIEYGAEPVEYFTLLFCLVLHLPSLARLVSVMAAPTCASDTSRPLVDDRDDERMTELDYGDSGDSDVGTVADEDVVFVREKKAGPPQSTPSSKDWRDDPARFSSMSRSSVTSERKELSEADEQRIISESEVKPLTIREVHIKLYQVTRDRLLRLFIKLVLFSLVDHIFLFLLTEALE